MMMKLTMMITMMRRMQSQGRLCHVTPLVHNRFIPHTDLVAASMPKLKILRLASGIFHTPQVAVPRQCGQVGLLLLPVPVRPHLVPVPTFAHHHGPRMCTGKRGVLQAVIRHRPLQGCQIKLQLDAAALGPMTGVLCHQVLTKTLHHPVVFEFHVSRKHHRAATITTEK